MPYNSLKKCNDKTLKITILGCGASSGVPRPNLDWGDCDPNEPKNRRTRSSLLIETHNKAIIIDTGPDFCQQMINARVKHLDAVIYTHMHADHTNGISDLKSYAIDQNELLPIYADKKTLSYLHKSFDYCFKTPPGSKYPPILKAYELIVHKSFNIKEVTILPVLQKHGDTTSIGIRVGGIAYCTDISAIDDNILNYLKGVKYLIIGVLQYNKHPSHLNVIEALELIEILRPQKTYFTHMHNKLDYNKLKLELPNNVEPAYDGLSFFV